MAEEPINEKKGTDLRMDSGVSAAPSADSVAEAFATFEKSHASHVLKDIPNEAASKVAPQTIQVEPPLVPAPVLPPTVVPAPKAPIEMPPIVEPVPPAVVPPPPIVPSTVPDLPQPKIHPAPAAPVIAAPIKPADTPPAGSLAAQALAAKLPEKPITRPTPPIENVVIPVQKLSSQEMLEELSKKPVLKAESATVTQPQVTAAQVAPVKQKEAAPSLVEEMRSQSSSVLHPLRTFRSDVETSVKEHKTSIVSVAAAEENRKAHKPVMLDGEEAPPKKSGLGAFLLVVSGVALLLLGIGALVFVLVPRKAPQTRTVQMPGSTLIYTDEVVPVPIEGANRTSLMSTLVSLRDTTALSLGLIRELYSTVPLASSTEKTRAPISDTLALLAPHMSEELLRTLSPAYVLGVHVYDGNQAFLILTTDSYEQTFSGLISWEPNMLGDLLPLFERRPRPRTPNEQLSTSTSPAVISSTFTDEVVENHDTRVHKDEQGNIVLLWTFLDRSTVVITTNERTLAELAARVRSTPTQGL